MTIETEEEREQRTFCDESMDRLVGVLKRHLKSILKYVNTNCIMKWPVSNYQFTSSILRLLDTLLNETPTILVDATLNAQMAAGLDNILVWSIIWSVGAALEQTSRNMFSEFLIKRLQEHESMLTTFDTSSSSEEKSPTEVNITLFDMALNAESGTMTPWSNNVGTFEYVPSLPFSSLFVPTVESERLSVLLDLLVKTPRDLDTNTKLNDGASNSVLCVGSSGVGKSVIMRRYITNLCTNNADDFESTEISLSAQTSSHMLQSVFENKLEKLRKTLLGPSRGRRMILFVDDLNMPKPDEYGSQPPLELLRQVIDNGGFYDRKKLFYKKVQKVSYVAACGPSGGGRNTISERFARHMHTIWVPEPPEESLVRVYENIFIGYLKTEVPEFIIKNKNNEDDISFASSIVSSTTSIYKKVFDHLRPTPKKSHYTFNTRDVSNVFQGMLMVTRARLIPVQSSNGTTTSSTPTPDSSGDSSSTKNILDIDIVSKKLLRLWLHEQCRVIYDRLVDEKDQNWFASICKDVTTKNFNDMNIFSDNGGNENPTKFIESIMFASLTGADDDSDYKEHQASTETDVNALSEELTAQLDEFKVMGGSGKDSGPAVTDLVFFRDAISHVARLTRILLQPRGNALLVGVGGSGRKSLARLASFMSGSIIKTIEVTSQYGMVEWREDIKSNLMAAGLERRPVVFMLDDTQVVQESFLEDINSILTSGEVLNIYEQEDIEKIVSESKKMAEQANGGNKLGREGILNYYRQKVRNSLHIIMTFSPIGNVFRKRMMQFPSFSNCCVVDWYHRWPKAALLSVARRMFHKRVNDIGGSQYVEPVSKVCMNIHASVEEESNIFLKTLGRYNYTTPTSYLELLRLLTDTVAEQSSKQQAHIGRYEQGVRLLDETSTKVQLLQVELTELQPKLIKASKDTDELMAKLQVDQKTAEETRKVASKEEAEASALAIDCDQQQKSCQAELDKAMPAYHSALKALDKLDKKSIGELKTFVQPPRMVGVVLEAVCLLLKKKTTWAEAKTLLGQLDFLDQLKTYDKDNMKDKLIRKVKKYTDMEEFTAEKVAKVSTAAMSLCMWVQAMVTYHTVVKKIAPMRATLADAQAKLAVVRRELAKKQEILAGVEATLAQLQKDYEASILKKENLLKQASDTKRWLTNAERLNGAVGSERDRWAGIVKELKSGMKKLLGNMIVSSGLIAYSGPFDSASRTKLTNRWLDSCLNNDVLVDELDNMSTLISSLGDDVTTRRWRLLGLPQDDFSTENAIIATRAKRWPLCIDPQTQANRWIKNMEKNNNLVVCKMSEGGDANGMVRNLENAIRVGLPLLIESLGEDLDPVLEPVLTKTIIKKGGETMMKIGEKIIPYDERFKLYMTTKLPNPHYLPDVCIKVTLINFGITSLGLEEQLLADVVKQERPELSAKRGQLIVSIASDQKKVLDMEDRVLTMLSESTGNILDNEELISKLETSKKTSAVVKTRIEEGEKTSIEISKTREVYRSVATRGSVLYFAIAQLASIDSMYQYSLQFFQKLYNDRIVQAPQPKIEDIILNDTQNDEEVNKFMVLARLQILINDITWTMFVSVCRGLFEKDKMVFAATVAANILKQKKKLTTIEWNTFLISPSPSEQDILSTPESSKDQEMWLTADVWCKMGYLQTQIPRAFSGLKAHVRKNMKEWGLASRSWFASGSNNDDILIPNGWDAGNKLTDFQRLLLIKAVRSDLLVSGSNLFVKNTLGEKYGEAPALDLQAALEVSSNATPLIFVLSSGADPMSSLLALAKVSGNGDEGVNMRVTSLGQGQGPIAESHIESASAEGGWVCLQNCHLAVSWLPRLEQIVEKQVENPKSTHQDYRMWLTSMPCSEFPVAVLQVGIKLSMQPPRGVRANMLRGLGTDIAVENFTFETNRRRNSSSTNDNMEENKEIKEEEDNDDIDLGTAAYCKMLYALVFYHACVLERRKFGGIGWNIPYEWMASDLKTGVLQLKLYLPHVYDDEGTKTNFTNKEYLNTIPFDAIQTMMGEINYGGRVTDKWDLRPVADILGSLMCRSLVDPTSKGYSLVPGSVTSSTESMKGINLSAYSVPDGAVTREQMMEHVKKMPLLDDPRLFGLDTNANITCQLQESNELMDTILALGGGSNSNGSDEEGGDQILQELGNNILSMFPGEIDREEAAVSTFANDETGGQTALAVVLTWEIIRFNKLIGVVRLSTEELLKAIQGLVVMSSDLEVASRDLQYQKVPSMWEAAAYPSLKPLGSWLTDLEQRIQFVDGWMRDSRITSSFWLSGLYFPQGFITGVKQQYARKTLIAIDRLKMRVHVSRNDYSSTKE
jgi:dynein heavy chain